MASYLTPGIYIEEQRSAVQPIEGVSTSVAAFLGVTRKGPVNRPTLVTSVAEFVRQFGGPIAVIPGTQEHYLYYAVRHFFGEGGTKCYVVRVAGYGDVNLPASLQAISSSKSFNGRLADGLTAVAGALQVQALTPGVWGDGLSVQVEQASRFSVLLEENVAGGTISQLTLQANQDVQLGSVLFVVAQVTGVVQSVNTSTLSITFQPMATAETGVVSATIADNALVFTPDMKFISQVDVAAGVAVTSTAVSPAIKSSAALRSGMASSLSPPASRSSARSIKPDRFFGSSSSR